MGARMRRLGYRRVELDRAGLFGPSGAFCYGHEFHYSEIEEMPPGISRSYLLDDGRREGYCRDNTLAGYVHLHWGRTPGAAGAFVRAMQTDREEGA
jgi:cobyrinic acid a,c-diamide synthase